MGYSDTTINHFMMYKAGLISFYGPSILCEFGEYVKMFDYTKSAIIDILFGDQIRYPLLPSSEWTDDHISWSENNVNTVHVLKKICVATKSSAEKESFKDTYPETVSTFLSWLMGQKSGHLLTNGQTPSCLFKQVNINPLLISLNGPFETWRPKAS